MQETTNLRFESYGLRRRNSGFNIPLLVLIIINCVVICVMLFFNFASSQDFGSAFFPNKTGDISDANEVNITPAGATFTTWAFIYIWQVSWLIFNVSLIFFKNNDTFNRLYFDPPVLTIPFHVAITLNFVFNAAWLFLWANQLFTWSLVFSTLMALTAYTAIFISTKNAYDAEKYLKNKRWVVWCYRLLVHNGLTFYATWLTVATLLNLAIAITYRWADQAFIDDYRSTSSIISLSILTTILLGYFLMDVYIFEKYLRYTWSQYIQLLVAFSGILGKNWTANPGASSIFALVLAVIVGIMFIIKICVTVVRTLQER